jgi:hypothetical protein
MVTEQESQALNETGSGCSSEKSELKPLIRGVMKGQSAFLDEGL